MYVDNKEDVHGGSNVYWISETRQHGCLQFFLKKSQLISEVKFHKIESFVHKFKTLWHVGRNATLSFKSNAGKAEAHLCVELGDASLVTGHFQRPRNRPSQQRRCERRAVARELAKAAEQANVNHDNA